MKAKTAEEIINIGFGLGASDIHIKVARPPTYRINNHLITLPEDSCLTAQETRRISQEILGEPGIPKALEDDGQVDFANSYPAGRVRGNLFIQGGQWALALRIIPAVIPALHELGLPPVVQKLSRQEKGMLLVAGASGSGKSTTLAGIINLLNQSEDRHIITLEDPVEYIHGQGTCIVNQREIGRDTRNFSLGLRAALRQDPDIIMVGEMRDMETISIALTAAETGHLVLASLHSGSALQTLERIINTFPPHQQAQARIQLAGSLLGIISQQLVPVREGDRRVLAAEILVVNQAVRNLIRANKIHQLFSVIQTGSSWGMISMDKALRALEEQNIISAYEVNRRLGVALN